ncbi:MAG: ABC transporter permease subunit [Lapillicoccus sp.]
MTWLSWRQQRVQSLGLLAAVAAATVLLLVTGGRLQRLATTAASVYDALTPNERTLWTAGVVVMAAVPALVGIFWGAPLVARELETGTHRLAWSQGVTRYRWLAHRFGLSLLVTVVAVGALSAAVSWWSGPLDGSTSQTQGGLPDRLSPVVFAMRGIVPVGYAVLALAVGVLAGLVLRRTLPAMTLTLVVVVATQLLVPAWVRPHLVPATDEVVTVTERPLDSLSLEAPGGPLTLSLATGHRGDWVLVNQTVDASGRPSALPSWFTACADHTSAGGGAALPLGPQRAADADPCLARLTAEGYRQHLSYVPADRFWPLQLTETALLLVVAGLIALAAFGWLRRRPG